MKKFTLLILAVFFAAVSWSQETITIGTGTTSQYSILGGWYGYERHAVLWTQNELATANMSAPSDITSIAINLSSAPTAASGTREIKIYVKEVTETDLNASMFSDWAALVASATLVYNQTATGISLTTGWNEFLFITPYSYSGGSLLIFTDTKGNTNSGGGTTYSYGTANATKHWCARVDTGGPLTNDNSNGNNNNSGTMLVRPNIRITFEESNQTCPAPTGLTEDDVTDNSADISWTELGAANEWALEYKKASESSYTSTMVTTPYYYLTGLDANTSYNVRVRAICGLDDESNWRNITFKTDCGADALPFTEDFSGWQTVTTYFDPCWIKYAGTDAYSYYPYVSTSLNQSLYFYNSTTSNVNAAFLPPLDAVGQTLIMEFDLATSVSGRVEVITATNPQDTATWNIVDDVISDGTGTGVANYKRYERIINYQAGMYIGFKYYATSTYTSAYIDNIFIDIAPTCVKPTITSVSTTETSATVELTENGFAETWQYLLSTTSTMPDEGEAVDVSSTFEIEGLNTNTQYYIWVRSVCGFDDYSDWTAARDFRTACSVISLPYSEGFESYAGTTWSTAGPTPNCWYNHAQSGSATYTPHITNVNIDGGLYSYPHSGTNALTFTGGSGYGGVNTYAVLPPFDVPLDQLYLSFWYRHESASYGTLSVGYITGGQENVASYTPLFDLTSTTTVTQFERNLIEAGEDLSDATYIAIRWEYTGSSYYSAAIDDIFVDVVPECLRPTITDVSTTETSATVELTENGSAANWQYLISTTSTMPDESEAVDVSSSTFDIESLNASALYYIWVRSVCGFDEYSMWAADNFSTSCGIITLPWIENFNAATFPPACWTINSVSGTSNWARSTTDAFDGGHAYHGYASGTQETWLITPNLSLPAEGSELKFMSFIVDPSYFVSSKVFISTTTDAISEFEEIYSLQGTDVTATWQELDVSLSAYVNMNVYIAFVYTGDFAHGWRIDDVSVALPPTCPRPAIANIVPDETGATVTLTENGSAANWQYLISTTSTMPNESEAVDVSENPFEIEGLNASTQYYIWVRSACGFDEYSLWTAVRGFRTTCGVMSLPFVEGFEDGISDCWANIDADGDGFKWEIGVETSSGTGISAHSGTQSAISASWYDDGSWYGQELTPNNYLVTPKLAIPVEGVAALTYWVAAQDPTYPQDHYSVKISTTDLNPASFIEVFEETLSTSEWQERTVVLSDYSGQDIYIAFVHNECTDWFVMKIDDVEVAIMPNCPRPTITSVSTTETSATVELTENGSAANWQYLISTTSTMPDESEAVDVSENPFEIEGLEANTQYYIWVRSVCGFDEYSLWTAVRDFRTLRCNDYCEYRIEGTDSDSDGWNGNGKIVVTSGSEVIAEWGLTSGASGQGILQICPDLSITFSWSGGTYLSENGFKIYDSNDDLISEVTTGNLTSSYSYSTTSCPVPPDCQKPLIASTAPASDGATVTLTERGDATNWQYLISTTSTMPDESNAVDVSENPFEIEGLDANTQYYIWARSVCGLGEYSDWTAARDFKTTCVEIPLPWSENFDASTAVPNCWGFMGSTFITTTSYASSAPNSLRFYGVTSVPVVAVTPPFDADVEGKRLEFKLRKESDSYSGTFDVGYLTDISDATSFVAVYSNILPTLPSPNDFVPYSYTLSGFPANVNHIAFRQVANGAWYYWLDDVEVSEIVDNDVAAMSITSSVGTSCANQTSADFTVTVRNYGSNTQTGVPVKLEVDGVVLPVTQTVPSIVSDATETVTFTGVDISTAVTHTFNVRAFTDLAGDEVPANDATDILQVLNEILDPCDDGIKIGNGTTTQHYAPVYSFMRYNYTQTIYLASEIAASGGITGKITNIAYNWNGSGNLNDNNVWTVYIGHTSKTNFASPSDWVAFGDLDEVYSGEVTLPADEGWMDIELDIPFEWDGVSNIVVAVYDDTYAYSSDANWYSTAASNRTIYYNSDYTIPDPASPPTTGTTGTSYPNIKFNICDDNPDNPPTVTTEDATDVTQTTATLNSTITPGTKPIQSSGYEYRVLGETEWQYSEDGLLIGLVEDTEYEFRAFATTAGDPIHYGGIKTFPTLKTGITNVFAGKVTLYPNPAKQTTTLAIDGLSTAAQVVITDLAGREVATYNFGASETQIEMNVSNFADGTYLVRIITEKGNSIQKLVVKK